MKMKIFREVVRLLLAALVGAAFQMHFATRPQPDADLQTCYGALPVDQGQVTINTLQPDGHGGLVLHTQRLKAERQQLTTVPISKD